MCGLFAIWQRDGRLGSADLERPLDVLGPRGPDDRRTWVGPQGRFALGHTRLGVMDPAGGLQPVANEDGTVHAVVNGEFYGFEAIREGLEARGHRFRTRSDSEILVHLYEEQGLEAVASLRGEFAFILVDGRTRRLVAGRDRFGIKPLVYHAAPGRLVLGSEAKAVLAAGIEPVWDRAAVHQALSLQYLPLDRTLFEGIHQVPPGHLLVFEGGRTRLSRYWDLDLPRAGDHAPVPDRTALAEDLEGRLQRSVVDRMRSDVPVCFHLSGGLDSSTILTLAREAGPGPIRAFTVGFEDEGYDESGLAQDTADRLGIELDVIRVTPEGLAEDLGRAVESSEGLAVNAHLAAKWALNRRIREAGFKVVVSGEGADEILFGYPHMRHDLADLESGGRTDPGGDWVSRGIMLASGSALDLSEARRRLGWVPTYLESKAVLGQRVHEMLRDDHRVDHAGVDPVGVFLDGLDLEGQVAGRHPLDQVAYLWCRSALPQYILKTLGDGLEMGHGVEGRVPFLDHDLFAFTRTIPPEEKIRDGIEKRILRDAMGDRLVPAVRERRKHPFYAPPLGVGGGREIYRGILDSEAARCQPFFDPERVKRRFDGMSDRSREDRAVEDPAVFMALTVCLVQDRFAPR